MQIGAVRQRQTGWQSVLKGALDRSVALLGLGLTAPLFGPLAAGVWLSMGRPIFFVQERPGLNGRPFGLIKFRTMRQASGGANDVSGDAQRLTPFGQFLRDFSLDELPQLLNVLRGDMSLVGPRPLLTHYLPKYTVQQGRRHDVMPGITGWAQVNGRNATSWDERLRLDVEYVDNWSLLLDLRILLLTVRSVATRSGIKNSGHATMPEFTGTDLAPPGDD